MPRILHPCGHVDDPSRANASRRRHLSFLENALPFVMINAIRIEAVSGSGLPAEALVARREVDHFHGAVVVDAFNGELSG